MNLGLQDKERTDIAHRLNILLCSEFMLYTKTLNYHWNVVGKHFGPLHMLFNDQYEQLNELIDAIAERIRALGIKSFGTLKEFYQYSILTEQENYHPNQEQMLQDLLNDYETIIRHVRHDIDATVQSHDDGTNNFLSDLIEKHEKTAWILRSHLES